MQPQCEHCGCNLSNSSVDIASFVAAPPVWSSTTLAAPGARTTGWTASVGPDSIFEHTSKTALTCFAPDVIELFLLPTPPACAPGA